jgi:carbonic anhydrase/acetyltransferase-like protein (isoleucine patch superfamily)
VVGAIVIGDRMAAAEDTQSPSRVGAYRRSWVTVEALGKSPIARIAESLKDICDAVSVILNDPPNIQDSNSRRTDLDLATERFANYKAEGFETVLIVGCGAYVEFDAAEMLSFHQEHGSMVTRAFSDNAPLDVWMVAPSVLPEHTPLLPALPCARSAGYHSKGYVNLLQNARDFRRLVLDGFHSRCRLRPSGSEVKPGIWICEGAQIERSARVVAPAFIGRDAYISAECLITRGSNVESNSHVDFGTAVEDSSILSDSYVGIGLDLSHSIVDGHNLFNLRHNVNLEITDPVVMRQNTVRGGERQRLESIETRQMALSSAE